MRGKPFKDWKEERKYLREKWGIQGRDITHEDENTDGEFQDLKKSKECEIMSWETVGNFEDIIYEKTKGVAKVTINRPEKRNAFRPKTVVRCTRHFWMPEKMHRLV